MIKHNSMDSYAVPQRKLTLLEEFTISCIFFWGIPLLTWLLSWFCSSYLPFGAMQDSRYEFNNITHPITTQQLYLYELDSREICLVASYKYGISDKEVQKYYEAELTKKGWQKEEGVAKIHDQYSTIVYKKKRYVLSMNIAKGHWTMIMICKRGVNQGP